MEPDDPIGWDDLSELLDECRAMAHGLLLREQGGSVQSTALVLTALRRLRRTDQGSVESAPMTFIDPNETSLAC